jgi:hypothetical protein
MIFGTIIFLATLAAWLYASAHNIDTGVLWSVVTPVIAFLFIGGALNKTAEHAQEAATNTNGAMGPKIEAAVATALANRDMARTRQAQGDIADIADPTQVLIPASVITDANARVTQTETGS